MLYPIEAYGQSYEESTAIFRVLIPTLTGVHFLITYGCSAECAHCFIVTAVDEQSPPLIGYGTRGKSTRFEEVLRMSNYPCGMITLGQLRTPDSPQQADLMIRGILVQVGEELAHDWVYGPEAP